jgi:hypothetical protein
MATNSQIAYMASWHFPVDRDEGFWHFVPVITLTLNDQAKNLICTSGGLMHLVFQDDLM